MATSDNPTGIISKIESLIHPDCVKNETTRPIPNITDVTNPDTNKIISTDGKGFLFDIIVVRMDIANKTINDTSKLLVEVDFNGNKIIIASGRINVLDFGPESIMEFIANPLNLKEDLRKSPLRLKVLDQDTTIGKYKNNINNIF